MHLTTQTSAAKKSIRFNDRYHHPTVRAVCTASRRSVRHQRTLSQELGRGHVAGDAGRSPVSGQRPGIGNTQAGPARRRARRRKPHASSGGAMVARCGCVRRRPWTGTVDLGTALHHWSVRIIAPRPGGHPDRDRRSTGISGIRRSPSMDSRGTDLDRQCGSCIAWRRNHFLGRRVGHRRSLSVLGA